MTEGDRPSVVVVEDEPDLADTYARWLDERYEVATAYTGEESLELIDEDVDVVLLDRRLPGMKGREVLAEIRDRGIGCGVAMITAVDPDTDILDMGFDDYVVKPVLRDELFEIVERLLALASYDDQFREYFSVASKLTVLEEEKPESELAADEDYERIRSRFEALEDRIEATLAEFDTEDFASVYRHLGAGDDDSTSGDA